MLIEAVVIKFRLPHMKDARHVLRDMALHIKLRMWSAIISVRHHKLQAGIHV